MEENNKDKVVKRILLLISEDTRDFGAMGCRIRQGKTVPQSR